MNRIMICTYRSIFGNSRKRKVNKRKKEKKKTREKGKNGMKNVRKPQESVAKVVAVESRTGSWARVSPDYVPKKDL